MYLVIELQKNGDQVANIVTTYSTKSEAESKYHLILSSAAVSNVEAHSALMISDQAFPLLNQCYLHPVSPSPEPEPDLEPEEE